MRRKPLGYDDALKLLGGESKIVAALGGVAAATLAGMSLGGIPAAAGFFDVKDEIVTLGQQAITTLRSRLTGLGRFRRSELLEAAHAVLVISAFFAALDDLDTELGSALNAASLELTAAEQASLAASSGLPGKAGLAELVRKLITPGTIPGISAATVGPEQDLSLYYAELAQRVQNFATGTAVWDQRDETIRDRWSDAVKSTLPERALSRYEEQLARLSGDFPEFAFIAHRLGVRQILDELRSARSDNAELQSMINSTAGLLGMAARGQQPDKIREDLASRYREQISKPVAGAAASSASDKVNLPELRALYVNPSYRLLQSSWKLESSELIAETGWHQASYHDDLLAMVLEHLISTDAAHAPLMLLGQPGAGKSVFTQMLAAELDPRDFLVVRVELRAVPSDAGIQEQVEAALSSLTGRSIRWPELAEAAGDAQPVIILDGFDELLQASGISHFDFLERVQAFQEREAELDRPVAVLVTSRTAVANQVRYPPGTFVTRLEEFNNVQVSRWLSVWNWANPERPLSADIALSQKELARQPLLLFLLALFHSGGGNLTSEISQARLFERLFTSFVERDVAKLDAHLSEKEQQRSIQRDLDNLSMVAFSMFNRGRQSVTDADLIADLSALQPGPINQPGPPGRAAALSIADRMAGRFFFRLFVHRDQAVHGQQAILSTYEFLHASFGEFLIARWVISELSRLDEQARRAADDPYPQPPDDAKLHALLSVTALSTREQRILDFIEDLLTEKPAEELAALREIASALFRNCLQPRRHNPYPSYQPAVVTASATDAAYSANLMLLVLMAARSVATLTDDDSQAMVPASDLQLVGVPIREPIGLSSFYNVSRLWHSQLTPAEWASLLDVVRICLSGTPETPNSAATTQYMISSWRGPRYSLIRTFGTVIRGHEILFRNSQKEYKFSLGAAVGVDSAVGRAFREAAMLGIDAYEDACTAIMPYIDAFGPGSFKDVFSDAGMTAATLAVFIPPPYSTDIPRPVLYKYLLDSPQEARIARLLLGSLRDQIKQLPDGGAVEAALSAYAYSFTNIVAYLDILTHVDKIARGPEEAATARRQSNLLANLDFLDQDATHEAEISELVDLLDLGRLIRESGISRWGYVHDASFATDMRRILCLMDLIGLNEARELVDLRREEPSQEMIEAHGWLKSRFVLKDLPGALRVALWTPMTERVLCKGTSPISLNGEDSETLELIAPEWVARTRNLAIMCGFSNPFSGREETFPRANSGRSDT